MNKTNFFQGITLALVAGCFLFCGWGLAEAWKVEKAYTPTNLSRATNQLSPKETVRLHVIANSDDSRDQEAKLAVRDAIMESFGARLSQAKTAQEAEMEIADCLVDIEAKAMECLGYSGMEYKAKAALKTVFFPDKTYEVPDGNLVLLPKGDYLALQVVLGEGKGQNWWCVMYPPLCYFDLVQKSLVSGMKSSSPSPLPSQFYDDIALPVISEDDTQPVSVEIRFLFLDAVRAGLSRLASFWGPLGIEAQLQP